MLDKENLTLVYSAYVNYMSHFTPQSKQHELQLSKTFFEFFASNRHIINQPFNSIVSSVSNIFSTIKIIRRFIVENELLELQFLGLIFKIFIPDFDTEVLTKIEHFYNHLTDKIKRQRMLAIQSIVQFSYLQLLKVNFITVKNNTFDELNYKNEEFISQFSQIENIDFTQNIFDTFEQYKIFIYENGL